MKKILLFLAIVFFGVFFFWQEISDYRSELFFNLPEIEKEVADLIQETEKRVVSPEPLIAREEDLQPFLTRAGVILQTNLQREKYGLPPLQENSDLNAAALLKVQDMMEGQYFAHVSLSGEGVSDLAKAVGYEFIAIGENLAMGNFKEDQTLVQGWMDSPGHRENILSSQYQEIGVAVLQGKFEGKNTWLAVQHFALPLTACPQPSELLEADIAEKQSQLAELEKLLSALKQEIEDMKPKRGQAYSQKIEQHNELVEKYNALLSLTKNLIGQYNQQVILFNECAAGL